jgi:hypothetical protein
MDGSNGDIAVDQYHRYPVTQVTLFFFFLLVIICMRFVHNLSSIQAQDQCELNMIFLQVIKKTYKFFYIFIILTHNKLIRNFNIIFFLLSFFQKINCHYLLITTLITTCHQPSF